MTSLRSYLALLEAPLADFGTFGDSDVEGSFRPDDLRAIKSHAWRKKVENAFSKSPYKFNIYIFNGPGGMAPIQSHVPFWSSSKPEPEIDVRNLKHLKDYAGVQPLSAVERLIGKLPPDAETSISVVLVENEGSQRMPLTPWILVHRVVHALFESQSRSDRDLVAPTKSLNDVFKNFISTAMMHLSRSDHYKEKAEAARNDDDTTFGENAFVGSVLGKMKSAKNMKLANYGEFFIETVTQYIINGHVSFERPMLDDKGLAPPHPALTAIPKEYQDAAVISNSAEDFVRELGIKSPRMPLDSYTAYDGDGIAVATGDPDPQRLQKLKDRGLTVKIKRVSPRVKATYVQKMETRETLKNLWNEWNAAGLINYDPRQYATVSSDLHNQLDYYEKKMNSLIDLLLSKCIGKALVL